MILFAVGTGLYASAFLDRGSYEAVTFALAEKITGRLNLSEWHWIFWLLLQVFCLAESLVYASQFNIDSILPSRTIGTAFLFYTNSKHDILSNEIVLMRNGYHCYWFQNHLEEDKIHIPKYKSELTYVKREAEESLPRKKTARSNWPWNRNLPIKTYKPLTIKLLYSIF